MTYKEFRINILKANQKKHHFKVNNSYGTRDAYRWGIKNKFFNKSIKETEYRIIINTLNNHLQDLLLQGKDVVLPEKLGKIEVRKEFTYVGLEGDKIKTNKSVDWDKTLKLWYEDEESYKNKTLIRCEPKERFRILYIKKNAQYKNKVFYEFTPTRSIKLKLKEIINNQGFDALLIYNENGLFRRKCNNR